MSILRKVTLGFGIMLIALLENCQGERPPAPILIFAGENNFGRYTGEILKAEGFNEFVIDSISKKHQKLKQSYLDPFDIVILAESLKDSTMWDIFRQYVKDGGNLITTGQASPPEDLTGVRKLTGELNVSSIIIDSGIPGKGCTKSKGIRLHVNANKYSLSGARALAWFNNKDDVAQFPAVVFNSYGDGFTASFLYDLPRNIVYTRQGNPLSAGIEKDSIPGLRAMDMFTDGWIDTAQNTKNQADLQMTLLSYCISKMSTICEPLPRIWYFPDTLKCLVTLTNDGEFRGQKDFEGQFRDVDSMGAKMTLYVMETGKVTRNWAHRWTNKGFEISGHPDDTKEASRPTWNNMEFALGSKMNEVSTLYGLKMKTIVNHWFVWCGNDHKGVPEFAAQAEMEARHGFALDINYAHYDNKSCQGHFLGPGGLHQGNFTGSGLPMRFATSKGRVINIFQQLNNVYDQQYTENNDPEGFFNCFKGLMDRSLNDGVYSYISIKSHNDEYYFSKAPLLRMLSYSASKRIPVWTASRTADFILSRDAARFTQLIWEKNELSFDLESPTAGPSKLGFLIPYKFGDAEAGQVMIDGKAVPSHPVSVKGSVYLINTVAPGETHHIIVTYGNK